MNTIQVPKSQFEIHKIAKEAVENGWSFETWPGQGFDADSPMVVRAPNGKWAEFGDGVSRDYERAIEFAFGDRFEDDDTTNEWCWNVLDKMEEIKEMSQ